MKKYYLHLTLAGKLLFLKNYSSKLPKHAALFGLTETDTDRVALDAVVLELFFNYVEELKSYSKSLTALGKQLMHDDSENKPLPALTAPPTPPTFTTSPVTDIFGRLMNQVQLIKKNKNATLAILKDLGIDGIDEQTLDTDFIKPEISFVLVGGKPIIKWKKNKMDGIHLYIDRGDGKGYGAVPYTDMKPDFDDNFTLPASGQTAIWKYKAYYIIDDEEVGQVSNELVIAVSGI